MSSIDVFTQHKCLTCETFPQKKVLIITVFDKYHLITKGDYHHLQSDRILN